MLKRATQRWQKARSMCLAASAVPAQGDQAPWGPETASTATEKQLRELRGRARDTGLHVGTARACGAA
eukprot:4993952-Alexandrium_andersonii.AAC.1